MQTINQLRPLFLLIAAISFGLGISLPLIQLEKLYFFTESPSLLTVISGLWENDSMVLSVVIGIFSIIFPIAKLYSAFHATMGKKKLPGWVSLLGKWSLVDVMLVAIIIFAAKTSSFATAISQPGIWFYLASTLFTALAMYKSTNKSFRN